MTQIKNEKDSSFLEKKVRHFTSVLTTARKIQKNKGKNYDS